VAASVLLLLLVRDASLAIQAKVSKKVAEKMGNFPGPMKDKASQRLAEVASKRITPSKVASQLGGKLMKKMPKKMKQKGLTVEIKQVFCEGPYVVLELQVQHVDMVAAEKAMREVNTEQDEDEDDEDDDEAASNTVAGTLIEWSLYLMGTRNQKKLEEGFLATQVQAKLQTAMAEMMNEKLQEKQIIADCDIVKEEKQARYFYAKLQEVRADLENNEQQQRNNPIKEFRKKLAHHHNTSSSTENKDGGGGSSSDSDF
jgi:hypothetical protein